MADKEKKATQDSKVEKATTDESQAAAKVAKAAKGNNKTDKPSFFARASKGTKRFFKDFKGECKKIVWPDAKTVLKSTGVVLAVVTVITLVVWGIDTGLTAGVQGLKNLAAGDETTVSTTVDEHEGHDHGDETTEADEKDTTASADDEAETTEAEDETAETTEAEETSEAKSEE